MSLSSNNSVGGRQAPHPPDPVLVLSGKNAVMSLVFLDGEVILTGHQNGMIQEWNLPIRRAVNIWPGHSDTVLWLTTVPVTTTDKNADQVLLSQGRDGRVKAWTKCELELKQWTLIDQVPSAPLIFCNSTIIDSTLRTLLATPSEESSHINVHNISSKTPTVETSSFSISKSPVCVLKPADRKGYGMCMRMCCVDFKTPNCDGLLLVGYESGAISLWNALRGEMMHSHRPHDDSVMGLKCWWNPTSGLIKGLSVSVNNTIRCWTIYNDGIINTDKSVSVTNEGFNDLAIRKDGRIFVSGGWDGRGRVFGLKKLRPLAVLTYHKESINCVAFGPSNELVLASKDGYITFWDVYKNS